MPWIVDGSPQLETTYNHIRCKASVAKHCNALWVDDIPVGNSNTSRNEKYWIIHFESLDRGGANVGLCNQAQFKRASKIKCLAYNGNLTNGSSLLVGGFGPRLFTDDSVGILSSIEDDRLKVYFFVNGCCIGLAYNIPCHLLPDATPVIQFTDPGASTCHRETSIPLERFRVVSKKKNGLEGDWLASKIQRNGKTVTLKDVQPRLHYKVCSARAYDETASDIERNYVGILTVLNSLKFRVCQYKMHGPFKGFGAHRHLIKGHPDIMDLEAKLIDLVTAPNHVNITSDCLIVENNELYTVWSRLYDYPETYVGNPF